MSDQPDMSPDDTEFAGEYVLRVLPAAAHRAAATRAANDPVFAAEVRGWEDRLVSLTDDIMPVVPSSAVKKALMERLFGVDEVPGFFASLGLWKGLTGVLTAAAAALAFVAFVPDVPVVDAPRYVSELAGENDDLRILAVYDAGAQNVQITRTAGKAVSGRALQLWFIAEGQNPVSVGVLPDDPNATLALPADLIAGVDTWLLAVSDEPLGGSPTGQPTGAVLAAAEMTEL